MPSQDADAAAKQLQDREQKVEDQVGPGAVGRLRDAGCFVLSGHFSCPNSKSTSFSGPSAGDGPVDLSPPGRQAQKEVKQMQDELREASRIRAKKHVRCSKVSMAGAG